MELRRHKRILAVTGGLFAAVVAGVSLIAATRADVPLFRVDPFWPRPLEYPQILGAITGVAVGPQDNVYVLTRADRFNTGNEISACSGPTRAATCAPANLNPNAVRQGDCCVPTSPVLQFAPDGTLVRQWGGPNAAYTWFKRPHGIAVDPQGNVWIGGSGIPPAPPAAAGEAAAGGRGGGGAAAAGGRAGAGGGAAAAGGGAAGGGRAGGGAAAGGAAPGGGRAGGGAAAGGAAAGGAAAAGGGRAGAAAGGGGGGRGGGGGGAPAPTGPDTHILKFSSTGQFIAQIGTPNATPNSRSTTSFGGVARIAFDAQANEAYVADGYVNHRVVVLDITTGAVKRMWGAYGRPPTDNDIGEYNPTAPAAQQFRTVTCAVPSRDGMVYVCDRGNNRIQVFRKDGTFVSEKVIAPNTRGEVAGGLSKDRGSVWDIALSPDQAQRFLYVADGMNERIWILDRQSHPQCPCPCRAEWSGADRALT
jgi:hypothetical protein